MLSTMLALTMRRYSAPHHDVQHDDLLWFDVPESVDKCLERSSTCVSSATTPLHSDGWSWQPTASNARPLPSKPPSQAMNPAEATLSAASERVAAAKASYRAANKEVVLALADAAKGIPALKKL